MTIRKVSRADRRLANLIVFLESKLDSTSPRVAEQAVDRLSEILMKQAEYREKKEERLDRAAERECKLKLVAGKTQVPEELDLAVAKAQVLAELQAEAKDRDPFA